VTPTVRPARPDEIAPVGRLIAESFDHLDANRYLVPSEADRIRVMADFFTLLTTHAAEYGRVDVVDGPAGPAATAVWFDLTRDVPDPDGYDERMTELCGPYRENFAALDDLFGKHHPHEPHWHLAFLAVDPEHQHAGLGSTLMTRTHAELDAAGTPAYLEATNPDNIRLYRRHGYTDMDPFDIRLPDGTPFYRMWRPSA
jgi:ribosomal protein S18 acetylase RimI-like enzyme